MSCCVLSVCEAANGASCRVLSACEAAVVRHVAVSAHMLGCGCGDGLGVFEYACLCL